MQWIHIIIITKKIRRGGLSALRVGVRPQGLFVDFFVLVSILFERAGLFHRLFFGDAFGTFGFHEEPPDGMGMGYLAWILLLD